MKEVPTIWHCQKCGRDLKLDYLFNWKFCTPCLQRIQEMIEEWLRE